MLRCLKAAGELRQQHTLQAARLLQTVCLHQQLLPCLVTSICQEQAIHTNATTSSLKQHGIRLQQQQPHMPMCSPAAALQSSQRQHSSSQGPANSSHKWQQLGVSSLQQQIPLATSSLQQHGVQQRHGYSSLHTGAAHYHARHSGTVVFCNTCKPQQLDCMHGHSSMAVISNRQWTSSAC
jgi:hypothetical protein